MQPLDLALEWRIVAAMSVVLCRCPTVQSCIVADAADRSERRNGSANGLATIGVHSGGLNITRARAGTPDASEQGSSDRVTAEPIETFDQAPTSRPTATAAPVPRKLPRPTRT